MSIFRHKPEEIRTDRLELEKPEVEFDPQKEITEEVWRGFADKIKDDTFGNPALFEHEAERAAGERLLTRYASMRATIGEKAKEYLDDEDEDCLEAAHDSFAQFLKSPMAQEGWGGLDILTDYTLAGLPHKVNEELLDKKFRLAWEFIKQEANFYLRGVFMAQAALLQWSIKGIPRKNALESKIRNIPDARKIIQDMDPEKKRRVLVGLRLGFPGLYNELFKDLAPSAEELKEVIEQAHIEKKFGDVIDLANLSRILLADDVKIENGKIIYLEKPKTAEKSEPVPISRNF